MKYSDFLFELGVEELPSKAVLDLSESLATNVKQGLASAQVEHGEILSFGTPRRLAVIVKNVANFQAAQTISRRGPAVDGSLDKDNNPLPSLQGFARSCNVDVANLSTIKTEKGEWWFYESKIEGGRTRDILATLVETALKNLPIAKLMTWGSGEYSFVRPVHWAVMLFGSEIIKGHIFGVETSATSYGHRFHHPQAINISSVSSYIDDLYKGKVVASFATRRSIILDQIENLANQYNLLPIIPADLLDEVTSIVEWPCAILADFSEKFLQIPEETITASLQQHQKCFALKYPSGKLAPHFITISNIESKNPTRVKLGNEKVVRARLSDAAFFYSQDSKYPLQNLAPNLEKVVFHVKLGSVADKVKRITAIMQYLSPYMDLDKQLAERAAFLSKCDLLTGMVGEFPELQGIMGEYYAKNSGEDAAVALAIKEQYYPRFSADKLPESNYGLCLSLADRVDTLVGLFAIGQKPSGVKDPYKLRRHALAIVRILVTISKPLSLLALLNRALDNFPANLAINRKELLDNISTYILERMLSFYQAQGIDAQYFYAVKAQQQDNFFDVDARIKALLSYKDIPEATALSSACKRVDNILANSNINTDENNVLAEFLVDPAERDLATASANIDLQIQELMATQNYNHILQILATLKNPIDVFFDNVMVMIEDPKIRQNRLALLSKLQKQLKVVADIALIS